MEHLQQNITGFHTPGHQQGRGLSEEYRSLMEKHSLRADLTELPGLDNLKDPHGCIMEAQGLAAGVFGACQTFFLVNGSTVGLQAALLAVNKPQEKIIIPANAHVSVLSGLVLSGGRPVIIPVEIVKRWGIPLGAAPGHVLSALKNRISG